MIKFPKQVEIIEVGLRDGLQNEPKLISTEQKLEIIAGLVNSGIKHIEVGSFVSTKQIPQLANTDAVFQALNLDSDIIYSALVANEMGLKRALNCGVKHIALFTAASEVFCSKNINCTISQSLKRFKVIIKQACEQYPITFRAYISCAWDCPFIGKILPKAVVELAMQLIDLGCDEIVLADTTGKANPKQVDRLISNCLENIPTHKIAVHFHNNCGLALANIIIALQKGIIRVDSSLAGLGGCPSSPRASGNVASEDLLFMLDSMGINTGGNLNRLIKLGNELANILERQNMAALTNISD